jgi:hypothetical protein
MTGRYFCSFFAVKHRKNGMLCFIKQFLCLGAISSIAKLPSFASSKVYFASEKTFFALSKTLLASKQFSFPRRKFSPLQVKFSLPQRKLSSSQVKLYLPQSNFLCLGESFLRFK